MQDPENSRNQHEYSAEGFQSFAQDTTLHGARFLFVSNVSRRVVWNIAMVSCFSFCAYQVFLSVRAFYSYPFHTTVKRETAPKDGRELPFPAVTLCNLNPANTRRIRQLYSPAFHVTPTEEQLKQSIEDLSHLFARSPKVLTKEFKKRNPEFFHRPNSPEEVKEEMKLYALVSHQIEEMLLPRGSTFKSCSLNGEACGPKNFSKKASISYGQCYTFNSGKNGHPLLNVTLAGKDSGLKLRLNIERENYLKNPVASVGLTLLIHDQKAFPFMEGYGVIIQPGMSTVCAIKRRKISNLKWPYATNCTDQTNGDTDPFYSYTQEACLRKCRDDYTTKKCGCTLPEVNASGPICALNDTMLCLYPSQEEFGKSKDKKVCEENCPEACKQVEYEVSLSYGGLQREALIEHLMEFLNESDSSSVGRDIYAPLLNMTKHEREEFINDNIISLDLYFEDLAYDVIEQTPIYQPWTLVGNLGGTFGLFLGMSCLTVLEFVDFVFRRIYHWFKKRKIGKPRVQTSRVG